MAISRNNQPISHADHASEILHVHHLFPTIQGEGPFAGRPAVFLRLHGCNLQCSFCDTDYTSKDVAMTPHQILAAVLEILSRRVPRQRPLVVITGGEPFRQAIGPTVELLAPHADVQIETNGTLEPDPHFPYALATIVCSPKTPRINPVLAQHVTAYKYVLDAYHVDPLDGLPAGTLGKFTNTARPPLDWRGDIFLQPLDVQDEMANRHHTNAVVKSCLTFGYRLCIQTHKIVNLE